MLLNEYSKLLVKTTGFLDKGTDVVKASSCAARASSALAVDTCRLAWWR